MKEVISGLFSYPFEETVRSPSLRGSNTDALRTSILSVCQWYVLAAPPDGLSCCVNCISIQHVMPIVTFGLSSCCELKPFSLSGPQPFCKCHFEGCVKAITIAIV